MSEPSSQSEMQDHQQHEGPTHPFAIAMMWVQHVFTFVGMMVIPSWLGHMLDQQVWAPDSKSPVKVFLVCGALLGISSGFWYLLKVTSRKGTKNSRIQE